MRWIVYALFVVGVCALSYALTQGVGLEPSPTSRPAAERPRPPPRNPLRDLPPRDWIAVDPEAVERDEMADPVLAGRSGRQRHGDGQPTGTGLFDRAVADPAAGGRQQLGTRQRIAEASALAQAARDGDQAAAAQVAERLAEERDPRVRAALQTGQPPASGRLHQHAPLLPEPAAPAAPDTVEVFWVVPDDSRGTYHSTVAIAADGSATVETTAETQSGDRWHVRYNAWAWRDGAGNLVLDARGQQIELLERPAWGWWSPDSMVITPQGLVDSIDDEFDPGSGTLGARGPG